MPRCAWLALVFVLAVLGLSLLWASCYTDERWWLRQQRRERRRYMYRGRGRRH